eukprot:TRINITY_DN3988_c0_g3_i1.p1 TRINITY_DN3988_c0_g3~~TRINITY_DN3988_c0_g3_i1.p1  ORF type:complete len:428 (-),score=73.26 TRINITY_DN3988_c0_g3_i1:154-1380(-)
MPNPDSARALATGASPKAASGVPRLLLQRPPPSLIPSWKPAQTCGAGSLAQLAIPEDGIAGSSTSCCAYSNAFHNELTLGADGRFGDAVLPVPASSRASNLSTARSLPCDEGDLQRLCELLDAELRNQPEVSHVEARELWVRFLEVLDNADFRACAHAAASGDGILSPAPFKPHRFDIVLEKGAAASFGFGVHGVPCECDSALVVDQILAGGVLDRWNQNQREEKPRPSRRCVHPFAAIVEVDGTSGDCDAMSAAMKSGRAKLSIVNATSVQAAIETADLLRRLAASAGAAMDTRGFWRGVSGAASPSAMLTSSTTATSSASRWASESRGPEEVAGVKAQAAAGVAPAAATNAAGGGGGGAAASAQAAPSLSEGQWQKAASRSCDAISVSRFSRSCGLEGMRYKNLFS